MTGLHGGVDDVARRTPATEEEPGERTVPEAREPSDPEAESAQEPESAEEPEPVLVPGRGEIASSDESAVRRLS